MQIGSIRKVITAVLAVLAISGATLVGLSAANAASGSNCTLRTLSTKAQCDAITVALVGKVVTLDPINSVRTSNPNYVTRFLIQGQLFRNGRDGLAKKDLVDKFSKSHDGLTWTFVLKTGLKYSDGVTPVTADDVVFSWEYLKKLPAPTLGMVTDVKATNSKTVVFKLSTRFDDLPITLAGFYFMINPRSKAEGNPAYWNAPLSAGPYKIKSWTPGNDDFVIEANPQYWAKPAVKQITFLAIPDANTRVIALRQGTIDYAFDLPMAIARSQLSDKKTFRLLPHKLQGTFTLDFNVRADTKGGPKGSWWQNAQVRQALSYAIDRKTIGTVAFFGAVTPACSITWPSSPLASCAINGGINQDLAKAKSMLADAGYTNGIDPATKSPMAIEFKVQARAGWPEAAALIAADWAKIGVQAKVIPEDDATANAENTAGDFQVRMSGGTGAIVTALLNTYWGVNGAWHNWAYGVGVKAGQDSALLNQIDSAASLAAKKALVAKAEAEIWKDAVHISLGQRFVFGATRLPANTFEAVVGNDNYYVAQTPALGRI
jgi:ABC-type transport system substrate-binding protein